jgi:hypothetical protein
MKKLTFLKSLLLGVLMTVSANMYALRAGDIAIIAVNTDATKTFTFVALADIPASTTISFTDNAWNATTPAWRTGEGTIQWSHTEIVNAGTVITLTVNANPYSATIGTVTTNTYFNLSTSGDQILAYQGTTAPTTNDDANWLFAFSTENFLWGNNTNTSDVPTALTGASVAMTTSTVETDNAYFADGSSAQSSVTVSGTKSELLALFMDASKYYKDDAAALTIPTYTITITSSNPVAATPTFSPAAGTYTSAQSVTISCATSGASIYYTTDGTDPNNTGNGTLYSGAISVTSTTTIKAIAYADGFDPSAIASATYTINTAPTITVTDVSVPAFSTTAGSTQSETITVSGTNLTGDITLALSGTDAAAFSLSENSITPTAGSVTDKVITITYAPTAPGSHTATLTLSSTGAENVVRDLSGTATLAKPTVTGATNVGKTSLTLNWNAVTGATEYEVNVYTKTIGTVTATDLFISEYGEGDGGNKKYVEIFNGTGNDVDLSNYVIKKGVNGGGWDATVYNFPASTVLTNGSTFVLANNSTDVIGATAYDGTFCSWNGDDAIGLFKNEVLIDIFGVPDSDPGTGWSVAGILNATVDHILIRKPSITSPTTDWSASAGTTADDSQWIVSDFVYNATDQTTNLGSHTMDGSGTINTPITGSPFTTSGTSLQVNDLTAATTYYYTVTAKNGSYVSPASDEASASTLGTATGNVSIQGIFVRNGKVVVTTPAAGESIEIYNAVGQRLVSKLSTEGENEIAVPAKGILLVKAGSQVTKVMVP